MYDLHKVKSSPFFFTLCRSYIYENCTPRSQLQIRHFFFNLNILIFIKSSPADLGGSVGCAVRLETRRSRVQPHGGRQHSFVEIDHEIFSTVILSLLLIQEGQLSVSGERMCTILVNRLED